MRLPWYYSGNSQGGGLQILQGYGGYGIQRWNLLMAASLFVMLPVLLLFFFAQKYFIQGIVTYGVKG